MADWLHACGITTIAMESTGVYWIPAFEIVEERALAWKHRASVEISPDARER